MKKQLLKTYYFILLASIFHSDLAIAQSFTKITSGAVVSSPGDSRSVNWIDVNNDDFIDLQITNGAAGGQNNFLYLNDGNSGFTPLLSDTIVKDGKPSDGATWADTDNDGDWDCFVANWYNSIGLYYTNNGNGTFQLNTNSGLSSGITYAETAAWGDYDSDGLVDLYVTRSGGTVATNRNFLYHNNSNNFFTKINTGTLVTDALISRSANWTDIDLDGDLDLFVSNEGNSNNNENIYRNDSAGVFTKLSSGVLLNDGKKTMSSSWADFDNDGDLDVFLANENSSNALFRNDGNFNFTKLLSDTVSTGIANSFSSAWSDVDNDGDVDLFVTNSFLANTKLPCYFYINNGNGTFSRIGNHTLTADSAWTYGCAFGDYDNDGFEDLAVATCRFQGIDQNDFLYHNDGNLNNWVTFKLIGVTSNKSAIGAKVRIKATLNGIPTWQFREITAQSSYCGQNDMRAHFGLANATQIDSVKVEWPSGTIDFIDSVSTNQFFTLTETQGIQHIKSNEADFELFVYPNPSNGTISLNCVGFFQGDEVLITNYLGDTLSKIKLDAKINSLTLDLRKNGISKPGNYYITLLSKGKSSTKKITVL
jgi:hypothetical protein